MLPVRGQCYLCVQTHFNHACFSGRDAIRAIRKRLQSQIGRNNAIVMYTLTVLETCVKNCDNRFKALACQKDFVNELVKLMGPKFDAPQIVQERILSLIQVSLAVVSCLYNEARCSRGRMHSADTRRSTASPRCTMS